MESSKGALLAGPGAIPPGQKFKKKRGAKIAFPKMGQKPPKFWVWVGVFFSLEPGGKMEATGGRAELMGDVGGKVSLLYPERGRKSSRARAARVCAPLEVIESPRRDD